MLKIQPLGVIDAALCEILFVFSRTDRMKLWITLFEKMCLTSENIEISMIVKIWLSTGDGE